MTVRLCINSDDFGYTAEINAGILEGAAEGVLTSVSVMTRLGHEHEVSALASHSVSVGLHFDLTSSASADRLGYAGVAPLLLAGLSGRLDEAEIRNELERQWDELKRAWGGEVSHLDCHHHVHVLPAVRRAVEAFAEDENVASVRCPREPIRGPVLKSRMLGFAFGADRPNVAFLGTSLMGRRFRRDRIEAALDELERQGWEGVELMVHAGRFSPGLEGRDAYNRQRVRELEVLLEMKDFLRSRFELVPMQELHRGGV